MEARIYKPKRHRNGKRTTGRLYRARVKLTGDNKVRDISLGVSDKQVAQQKLGISRNFVATKGEAFR